MAQIVDVDAKRRQVISGGRVENAFVITPSDVDDLPHPTVAIYVGIAGNIKLDLIGGDTITLTNLAAGAWHPISATKVYTTDTTATEIVGAY